MCMAFDSGLVTLDEQWVTRRTSTSLAHLLSCRSWSLFLYCMLPWLFIPPTNIVYRPFASYTTTQSHTAPNSGPTSSVSATSSTQAPTHASSMNPPLSTPSHDGSKAYTSTLPKTFSSAAHSTRRTPLHGALSTRTTIKSPSPKSARAARRCGNVRGRS